jgi:hypothetical protein
VPNASLKKEQKLRINKCRARSLCGPTLTLVGGVSLLFGLQTFCSAQQAGTALESKPPVSSATGLKSPAQSLPKTIKIGTVTVSGSIRGRWENTDWYDTDKADGNYNFGALVVRVGLSQSREKLDWQIEAEGPLLIDLPTTAIAPAPQGQLGLGASYFGANGKQDGSVLLKQGFVRFKGLFGDKANSLRLGRFEFNDGAETIPGDPALAAIKATRISQRLIGAFGFSHVGRSFDGVNFVRNTKDLNLTFVAARPTKGAFQLNGNAEMDVDFYYFALTRPLEYKSGAREFRIFGLHYHDGRGVLKTDNRSAAARNTDHASIRVTTVGGHYIGVTKAGSGKVDFLAWAAGQLGSWGQLDHRAGAIAAEAGWQPGPKSLTALKPWLRVGYFRSTGDDNATDGAHQTFFQVLPTPRIYARFPFFNLMNNEDVFGELIVRPRKTVSVRADLHHLRLSSARDLWYSGGGAFQNKTFGYTGRPTGNHRNLGWLADVSADWNIASRTTLTFYFSESFNGAAQRAVYPLGNRARYAYLELTQRF